jgi:hypothetical protein
MLRRGNDPLQREISASTEIEPGYQTSQTREVNYSSPRHSKFPSILDKHFSIVETKIFESFQKILHFIEVGGGYDFPARSEPGRGWKWRF